MKSLKPSMRERKRYLLVRGENLKTNVEKSINDFVGVLGMSKVGLRWIQHKGCQAIISVDRKMVDFVKASFCIYPERIEIKRVSGSLRKIKNKTFLNP
jgi:RNase P/RNase MRP subunit POP5